MVLSSKPNKNKNAYIGCFKFLMTLFYVRSSEIQSIKICSPLPSLLAYYNVPYVIVKQIQLKWVIIFLYILLSSCDLQFNLVNDILNEAKNMWIKSSSSHRGTIHVHRGVQEKDWSMEDSTISFLGIVVGKDREAQMRPGPYIVTVALGTRIAREPRPSSTVLGPTFEHANCTGRLPRSLIRACLAFKLFPAFLRSFRSTSTRRRSRLCSSAATVESHPDGGYRGLGGRRSSARAPPSCNRRRHQT